MAGLLNATAADLSGLQTKKYNGQDVMTGQGYMDQLASGAKRKNMSAQDYDKMLNPTTYGARWGIDESQMAKPAASTGLLNATAAPPAPPAVATYDPIKATSGTATTTKAAATNAGSTGYTAANVNLKPEASAAYQLNQITSTDSPLNTSARAFADQQSNRRGLLNSSIAVGASQDAVLKNAMPLAQQDANTYFQAGMADAASTNRASEFTAGASNTAALNNSQLGTDVSKYNAGSENDTSKFNVQQDAQTSQFNASAGNSAMSQQASAANQMALQEIQGKLQKELAAIQANANMSLADKQHATQRAIADANNKNSLVISQADNETKKLLTTMDAETRINLANIGNAHDTLIKNNSSASSLMQQTMVALANISASTMDQTAKDAATQNMLTTLSNSLDAIHNYDGLRLSEYFPQIAVTTPATATPQASPLDEYKNIGTIDELGR